MPTIILVRHGETHWNREKRLQGHADSPLTLKGIAQAQAYGRTIAPLVDAGWRVVSSPLGRCRQTAAILCETAGLDFGTAVFDDRLKEVGTGTFSGRLRADMEAGHPEMFAGSGLDAWYFRCPGGETHADMSTRLSLWLAEQRAGDMLVVVSHGVAGKMLRGLYAGLDPARALGADSPQDAVYRLAAGSVERMACK